MSHEEMKGKLMAWYSTGEEAENFHDEDEAQRAANRDNVYRFWMPPPQIVKGKQVDTLRYVTFVDPEKHPVHDFKLPFVYLEHNMYLNGSWKNWFTCLKKDGDCPLCASGDRPYLAAAFTVIDHTEWKSKDGTEHKDELKLYIVKSKVLKDLRRAMAKRGALRGWRVELARTQDTSPGTGEPKDFEEKIELPDVMQPFDYLELLAPKTKEELMEIIGEVDVENDEAVRF